MNRVCPSCGEKYPSDVAFCGQCGGITVQANDPSDPDIRLGQQLGQYLVVARVADGAMGRVYEGRHLETRDRVAIKILHPHVVKDHIAVERFKREYETAEMLAHNNIVRVIELCMTPDGSNYLVMEYLQGEELGQLLRREGAIRPARMIRIICQSALALEHAHSFGVVHRDLKPDNIFLCESAEGDVVRLLDFGSVKLQVEMGPKLTAFGTTLGSPYYMSPEQAMGKNDVDHRTDIFALAAILYEMSTGKIAFDGPNVAQILMKIVQYDPPAPNTINPAFSVVFSDVVEHGLQKSKTNRTSSVIELAREMLVSFGLDADVAKWAATPTIQIEHALTVAIPAQPKPIGSVNLPSNHPFPHAVDFDDPPPSLVSSSKGSNYGVKIFAGVVILLVVIGVLIGIMR